MTQDDPIVRLYRKSVRIIELSMNPQFGFSLLLFNDLTRERRVQKELQLAASVFSHASEGIIITDPDGRILGVNEAFSRITGYPRDQVLGNNPSLLQSGRHDASFYRSLWDALSKAGQWRGEIWNRRRNGGAVCGVTCH